MLRVILEMDHACRDAVEKGASFGQLAELAVHGKIARMKYIEEAKISEIDELALEVRRDVAALTAGGGEDVA